MSELHAHLVKLESAEQVAVGDTVYEVVRHNSGEHGVKYNPYVVEQIERRACTVKRAGTKEREIKLHFKQLMVTRKEGASELPPEPEPASAPAHEADAVSAWLDMGDDVLRALQLEEQALAAAKRLAEEALAEANTFHSGRVLELEAQLKSARSAQGRAQAEHAADIKDVDKKLEALGAKRAGIQRMLNACRKGELNA